VFWFRTLGALELTSDEGDEVVGVVASGKLVALLAYLAVATPRGFQRRDSIIGLLWPELNQERARAALRHSLYRLRGALGADAIMSRGDEDIGLAPGIVECDAVRFEELLAHERAEEALLLYEGDLLSGFYVRGAPEYERWLDGERSRLRKKAALAACALAESASASARAGDSASWGRRAISITPDDEQILRRVLTVLERVGDRSGALMEYESFAQRLAEDYDAKPAAETVAIAVRLRAVSPPPAEPGDDQGNAPPAAVISIDDPAAAPIRNSGTRGRTTRGLAIAASVLLLAAAGYGLKRANADDAPSVPTIAVLPFQVRGSPEVQYLAEGMTDLLSINVDGAGGLQAADPRAILSLVETHGGTTTGDEARELARAAGAELYITGSVVEAGGRITLSAKLYDRNGRVKASGNTRTAPKAELFELVDELARQLVSGADATNQGLITLAGRTTRSIPALRAYLEGERELRAGRHSAAVDAFRQATEEDSTFALAWYRLASAGRWTTEYDMSEEAAERAYVFGAGLPPYALRLLQAAREMRDGNYARSESLYVKSTRSRPADPEGWFGLGDLYYHYNALRGRSKGEARAAFEKALALDPGDGESRVHLLELAAWEGRVGEVDSLLSGLPPGSDFAVKWPLIRALIINDREDESRVLEHLRTLSDREVVRVIIHSASAFPNNLSGGVRVAQVLTDPSRANHWRAYGYNIHAQIELARGRWSAARNYLNAMASLEPAAAIEYGALYTLSPSARATSRDLVALRAALAGWDAAPTPPSANVVFGLHNGKHETLRLYLLGLVSSRLADTASALEYADSLARVGGDSIHSIVASNLARAVRARVTYARGDTNGALRELGQPWIDPRTQRTHYSAIFAQVADRYFMAELLEKSGQLGEAIRAYSSVGDYSTDGLIYMPMSHLRRADIYLRMGDRERAASHYAKFADAMKDCDPALRQLRNAAVAKVTQLSPR
jgi:DNA-binding SARP family transcriptional activator/tetratricopeptide (TPR) repeat protein